jgi:tRNA(Ile)-lysidine synthase
MEPGRLALARLAALAPPRGRNLLRHFLGRHGVQPPSSRRLDEFLRQAATAAADARVGIDLPDWLLRVWGGAVWLVARVAPAGPALAWNGDGALSLGPGRGLLRARRVVGGGLSVERIAGSPLEVRWRAGGERLRPGPGAPRRPVKALWQEAGVPPWMRARLPLVHVGGELAWVAGAGTAWESAAGPGEPGIAPEWVPEAGFGPDGRPLSW